MPDISLPYSLRQGTYMPSSDQHLRPSGGKFARAWNLGPEDHQRRGTQGGPPVVVVGVVVVLLLFLFRRRREVVPPVNMRQGLMVETFLLFSLLLTSYIYR